MEVEAPDKIYLFRNPIGVILGSWYLDSSELFENIEYTRTDTIIERACDFLYDYNQKQVLKHGARATLGRGEYTINVDDFRKYVKGEKRYD